MCYMWIQIKTTIFRKNKTLEMLTIKPKTTFLNRVFCEKRTAIWGTNLTLPIFINQVLTGGNLGSFLKILSGQRLLSIKE